MRMRARSFCVLAVFLLLAVDGFNHAVGMSTASPFGMSAAWANDDDDGDDSGATGGNGGSGGSGSNGGSNSGNTGVGSGAGGDGNQVNTNRQPTARLPNILSFLLSGGDSERNEVLVSGLTVSQRAQLSRMNYQVVVQRSSGLIGSQVDRVKLPTGVSTDTALTTIGQLAPRALVDRNHFYFVNQDVQVDSQTLVGWGNTPSCNQRVTLGMIDTGVDKLHDSLRGQSVQVHTMRAADRSASDAAHGTAVASLLVGRAGGSLLGLLPRANLLAVDAFHQGPRQDSRMDAFDFAAALDWLVQRGVKVVNLSFSGPHNGLIERSIQAAQKRGVVLVAAVGNDGPMASPRYPAAYPGVIAVTAVRSDLQVFRRAVRGQHLSLSAPGVDVKVADTSQTGNPTATALRSGTSYAAPFVSAAATLLQANGVGRGGAAAVYQRLIKTSLDLGTQGFDPMFGHGLLQMGSVCQVPATFVQQAKAL